MTSDELKLKIEDLFASQPQKTALATNAVDAIYASIATLASLGLTYVLVEASAADVPFDRFPLMLHGPDGTNLTVHDQTELEEALASGAGWEDKTPQQGEAAPGPVPGVFGDFSPTIVPASDGTPEGASPEPPAEVAPTEPEAPPTADAPAEDPAEPAPPPNPLG